MKLFFPLLTILFIGLKLTNYIDWSWWLVLLPLYGPPIAIFTIFFIVGAFIGFDKIKVTRTKK